MKQIQKRYIYSALLASAFFIIIYALLKVHIIISILLTGVIYVGGIFLFKKDDIREFTVENVNTYYYLTSRVLNQAKLTNNEVLYNDTEEITKLTDEILVSLSQRPKKVEQAFDFFDYYLDIAYKILYKYNYIQAKENSSLKEQEFMRTSETHIKNILESFKKQLKNMQESKIIDIENEIKMFEQTSGINATNVEVGENNEK